MVINVIRPGRCLLGELVVAQEYNVVISERLINVSNPDVKPWIVHSQTNSKKFPWQTNFVYPESENTLWWEVF